MPKRPPLQRQPSDLVLVLPRPERVIDIGEESKREPGGSVLGGLGASLARCVPFLITCLMEGSQHIQKHPDWLFRGHSNVNRKESKRSVIQA